MMSQFENIEIFNGTTLADLFKEIHTTNRSVEQRIDQIIKELQEKVENVSDVVMLSPIIKDYLDTTVKNNDILIKMARIIEGVLKRKLNTETDDDVEYTNEEIEEFEILRKQSDKFIKNN